MATQPDNLELSAELLMYHLGVADAATQARVEQAFAGRPQALAEARAAIDRVLAPLNSDAAPTPPNLSAAILARIEAAGRTIPIASGRRPGLEPAGAGRSGSPLLSFRDFVGVAAAILIFVGIFIPGYSAARSAQNRVVCMNNLRQIGNGYLAYASANGGQLPYAGAAPTNAAWFRVGPGVPFLHNSQHGFKLVAGRYVPGQAFVCPGRPEDAPLQSADAAGLSDFPDERNNSYSMQLVTRPWQPSLLSTQTPIIADMTPLIDGSQLVRRAHEAPSNSRSHGAPGGQNVGSSDMSVAWRQTPHAGARNDDIYRIEGVQEYTGLERPRSQNDAFLVP